MESRLRLLNRFVVVSLNQQCKDRDNYLNYQIYFKINYICIYGFFLVTLSNQILFNLIEKKVNEDEKRRICSHTHTH